MKVFAGLAALLFAYSAFVQINDPDPIRWIAIYSCAAVVSAASVFGSIPRSILMTLACVAGSWAATLLPGVLMEAAFTATEEEREFLGLMLVCIASAVLWRSGVRGTGTA